MDARNAKPTEHAAPGEADGQHGAEPRPDGEQREPRAEAQGSAPATTETATAEPDAHEASEGAHETSEETTESRAVAHGGSFWSEVTSAEALSLSAIFLSGTALVGTRLIEMFASVTATDQVSALIRVIIGDGAFAALGVALGLVALGRHTSESRLWARWISSAAIVIGLIAFALAVAGYVMAPEPQPMPQQPMPQ